MVEIAFPIEFVVDGVPASLQAGARSRQAWMARVRQASLSALPEGHFATADPLAVTLLLFPDLPGGSDLDNMVKPILDALNRHVYIDDRQVERIWAQRFPPRLRFTFDRPSRLLAETKAGPKPALYVRITDQVLESSDAVV